MAGPDQNRGSPEMIGIVLVSLKSHPIILGALLLVSFPFNPETGVRASNQNPYIPLHGRLVFF